MSSTQILVDRNHPIPYLGGGQLVDPTGRPISTALIAAQSRMTIMNQEMRLLKQQLVRAKYDAAQTFVGNEMHWAGADNLGPHRANELQVRRLLRSRSRYEVVENNPFLKGTILSIANDFVGAGPRLEITDTRITSARRKQIEDAWDHWCKVRKIRRKLWRMRVAKIVDGETFAIAYRNGNGEHPVELDFQILEADQVSSFFADPSERFREVDGVRFDPFENPLYYHILNMHPGDAYLAPVSVQPGGTWVDARLVIHWFRQDRGWLRGIPELTPSLPLCALLRRYTLATVKHAETAADLTAIIETQSGVSSTLFTDGLGNFLNDDPFDAFPVEIGMMMNLPRGYALKQLNAVPLGGQYDAFVSAVLREICRPILTPANVASGTSKDSNMASGVLDIDIYKGGQVAERLDCDAEVMDKIFRLWWQEASLIRGVTRTERTSRSSSGKYYSDDIFNARPLERKWRWDKIGIDHPDPAKVAQALEIMLKNKIMTDRQVQEEYFNRDYEDWQKEVKAEEDFRLTLPSEKMEKIESKKPKPTNPQAAGSKSNNRNRSKSKQPRKVKSHRPHNPSRNGHSRNGRLPIGFHG